METVIKRAKRRVNGRVKCDYRMMRKFLKNKGYYEARQNATDHIVFKNDNGRRVIVADKTGTIPPGTMSSILRQTNSNNKELANFLRKK